MDFREVINIDPEILGGCPVFTGTRVPVETLFDHLKENIPLDEFLDDFPTVSRGQAVALLEIASRIANAINAADLYAAAVW